MELEMLDKEGKGVENMAVRDEEEDEDSYSTREKLYIFVSYVLLIIIATTTGKLIVFEAIVGATVINYVIMIGPAYFYLKLSKFKGRVKDKIYSIFMFTSGIILLICFIFLR